MSKVALICGISGQDGTYLAKLLLGKGYKVYGTSRDAEGASFSNLRSIGIFDEVTLLSMMPEDYRSVFSVMKKTEPDEVYFLAGQSSVVLSFEQPSETIQSSVIGTSNMLEACRMLDKNIRFYQAGSGETFGGSKGLPANEETSFNPLNPYAVGKVSAFWLVNYYRQAYKLFACTGILFNHESPLRPERYVSQKIISAIKRIKAGSNEFLQLGRMDISRDWGWAPEFVEAMWLMLQQTEPTDFVIATGKTYTLENFVETAFSQVNLDWKQFVKHSDEFLRPTDLVVSRADPSKAQEILKWEAKLDMPKVIDRMLNS